MHQPLLLSKLAAEVALFRSGLEAMVFRPSYVVGPGDAFVPSQEPSFLRPGSNASGAAAARPARPI